MHISSAFSFITELVRELFDKFDLLVSQIIDVCEFAIELVFESCLRFGLSGSNTQPLGYVLLYILAVMRFSLKQWIDKERQSRG